jgi:quinol monooxygenase YgiN
MGNLRFQVISELSLCFHSLPNLRTAEPIGSDGETSMFVVMAFVEPRPEKEKEMADQMRSFRNMLQSQPGLVKTFVFAEQGGQTLVGVSMWTNEDAYQRAMAAMLAPSPSTPQMLCGKSRR